MRCLLDENARTGRVRVIFALPFCKHFVLRNSEATRHRVRDKVKAEGSQVREVKRDVVLAVPGDTLGGYNVCDRCFFKCRWPARAARKGLMQASEWQSAPLAMLLLLHVSPCSTKSCG